MSMSASVALRVLSLPLTMSEMRIPALELPVDVALVADIGGGVLPSFLSGIVVGGLSVESLV